ncbi:MAG TPA: Ig-like domain-containing protein, partial [Thermohalobaculum sp.]|nr:Ig-like domain-containing protein [Thermohalobaculum sp.]
NTAPTATVTAPANGTTVTEGTLVSFTGTATDAEDGTITASLVWTSNLDGQIGTGGGFSTSALSIGTHTVTASITDSGGLSGTDTVSVIVNPLPNTAPTATVTAPANGTTVTEGTLVSFTGTATDAEDGTISASLVWTSDLDGQIGTGGGFSTSTLSIGTHTVTASVTDSGGLNGTDTVSVIVNPLPNTAPTATVTAPANGSSFDEGTLISFTGTATDAEDGTITASLVWTSNLDGQIGTGGAFSTSTLSAGIHTVTASVTDSGGLSGQDAISVTVNGAPAVTNVHIADLDDDSAPAPRNRWDARVAVLVLDEVGAAIPNAQVSGSWTSGTTGGGSCTTNASGQCVVIKPNLKGNVTGATFEIGDITGTDIAYQPAENTDPDGDSDGTVINVLQPGTTPTNTAPSASITAPGDGSSFDPGVMVTFNGTASDTEDGDLSTSLSWSSDLNGPIGSGSTASSSILSEGTHVITASVTDSGGLSGTDTITVTIGSAPPPPPPPTGLTLVSAVGYKVKGLQWVDLTWSGATGTNVIIRRDGIDVETTLNDDFHPHSIGSKGSGSYNFQICETDGITCSGVVTVVF